MSTSAYAGAVAREFSAGSLSDLQLAGIGVLLIVLVLVFVWDQVRNPPRKK